MTLDQQLMDSALAGIRAALGSQPLIALNILDNIVQSSLGKVDVGFPYKAVSFLRMVAYWNLQESADTAARKAMEFGLESEAHVFKQRKLVYGELRAAEIAFYNGENLQAEGSFLLAEALAAGAGLRIGLSLQQLGEFYLWARHL